MKRTQPTATEIAKQVRFARWPNRRAEVADVLRVSIEACKGFYARLDALSAPGGITSFLQHAANHAPAYREWVGNSNAISDCSYAAGSPFPLLGREALHDRPLDFVTINPAHDWCYPYRSSGSTGGWLTIYHDRPGWYARKFWIIDELVRVDREVALAIKPDATASVILTDAIEGHNAAYYLPAQNLAQLEVLRFFTGATRDGAYGHVSEGSPWEQEQNLGEITVAESQEALIRLRKKPPPVLMGRPWFLRSVMRLDQEWRQTGERVRPACLLASGGLLYKSARQELEAWFGCPVYECYALTETAVTALGRPAEGLWVSPFVRLSVLDANGEEAEEGTGELVVTNLINWAMPIIRYRTGDLGTVEIAEDSTGTRRQRITNLPGRSAVSFTRGSNSMNPHVLDSIFERRSIFDYQVHQSGSTEFTARWIHPPKTGSERGDVNGNDDIWPRPAPRSPNTDALIERELRAAFERHLGPTSLHIEVNQPLHVPRGKFYRYFNKYAGLLE